MFIVLWFSDCDFSSGLTMAYSDEDASDGDYVQHRGIPNFSGHEKRSNVLPVWGNARTMNLNPLILTNIQTSQYYKGDWDIIVLPVASHM